MNDTIDALERLARLKGDGTISETEFEQAKRGVLQGGNVPYQGATQQPPIKHKPSKIGTALKYLFVMSVIAVTVLIVIGQFVNDIDLGIRVVTPGDGTTAIFVTSKNADAFRIDRFLINGRSGQPGCDFSRDMDQKNRDLFKSTAIRDAFPNGQTLKMGEGFDFTIFGCGAVEKIEVHTDKGDGSYTF